MFDKFVMVQLTPNKPMLFIVTSMVTIKSKPVMYYTNGYIYIYIIYINGFTLILPSGNLT